MKLSAYIRTLVFMCSISFFTECASIHEISSAGDTRKLEILLLIGENPNSVDKHGLTPLFYACANGHPDTVRMLLQAGAEVNFQTRKGLTPLHNAAAYKREHIQILDMLIKAGADVNMRNEEGAAPLHNATFGWGAQIQIVDILIQSGADVNVKNKSGTTPLLNAASSGRLDIARMLIGSGAKVDERDMEGTTALLRATYYGNLDMVRLLLSAGASARVIANDGTSPLMNSTRWRSHPWRPLTRLMIDAGVDPNVRSRQKGFEGWTALMNACVLGDLEILKMLINAGADVNAENSAGGTPLYITMLYNHDEAARILMERGADEIASRSKQVRDACENYRIKSACGRESGSVLSEGSIARMIKIINPFVPGVSKMSDIKKKSWNVKGDTVTLVSTMCDDAETLRAKKYWATSLKHLDAALDSRRRAGVKYKRLAAITAVQTKIAHSSDAPPSGKVCKEFQETR
ncbi:MAG: ankyrin repeat domain-containing protein [Spirochaetia bacterium]|nr:ankyrin repeat domain-containing protein [Spirochaetia bacterium]